MKGFLIQILTINYCDGFKQAAVLSPKSQKEIWGYSTDLLHGQAVRFTEVTRMLETHPINADTLFFNRCPGIIFL